MKFADNKNLYIRRALFALLIVITAACQHTAGDDFSILGARAFLLIPLTVTISMNEKSMGGLSFGLLAGVLWDVATARGDGFYSVSLALAGFTAGAAVTYLVRNNILASLLLTSGACLFVTVSYWLIFIVMRGYEGALSLLLSFYLPSAVYSLAFTAVYYYLIKNIIKLTTDRKQSKKY